MGLKGAKLAAVFVGIGVVAGIAIAFAIVRSQTQGQVITRVVEDNENPFLDPEFLKTYQTELRTGAHYKTQADVGEPAFFVSDAKGGRLPYTFEWKFSDGVTLTSQNSTRTFEVPGTYFFDLTVTDADGKKAGSTKMSIRVTDESPDVIADSPDQK
jgi:PKD repeat protein